jgi:hypothetical protein
VTSIFVSYARADSRFVQELRAALVAEGHRVWLDVDELGPSEDWLASIERAVEEATSFLFVVSPESVRSEICLHELRHATAHGRRVVALIRAGVEDVPLPDELAAAESIRTGNRDEVAAAVARLGGAVRAG